METALMARLLARRARLLATLLDEKQSGGDAITALCEDVLSSFPLLDDLITPVRQCAGSGDSLARALLVAGLADALVQIESLCDPSTDPLRKVRQWSEASGPPDVGLWTTELSSLKPRPPLFDSGTGCDVMLRSLGARTGYTYLATPSGLPVGHSWGISKKIPNGELAKESFAVDWRGNFVYRAVRSETESLIKSNSGGLPSGQVLPATNDSIVVDNIIQCVVDRFYLAALMAARMPKGAMLRVSFEATHLRGAKLVPLDNSHRVTCLIPSETEGFRIDFICSAERLHRDHGHLAARAIRQAAVALNIRGSPDQLDSMIQHASL